MSVTLSDVKNELIKDVALSEGFSDYIIDVRSGSMKGDGYLGIINTVCIEEKNKPTKNLNLVVKSAQASEKLRENAPVKKAYEREIYMYQTVFPAFEKLQEENGVENKFTEYAKCYATLFTNQHECLVLENLKEIGYKLWDRKVPMNMEHVEAVFAAYGRFHGCSYALRALDPEKFQELERNVDNIFDNEESKKQMEKTVPKILQGGFKAVEGNERATKGLVRYSQGLQAFFTEDLKNNDKYSVITHGDCWCNNMMFKYEDIKDSLRPTKVCLLDWQLARVGSPVLDLSYFFLACACKEALYDYERLLGIYHENLSSILKEFGCNPDELLPYAELERQWRKFVKYGLFLSLMVVKVMVSESNEAVDLGEIADSGKDMMDAFAENESVNIEKYYERISNVIIFLVDHDFI